MRAIAKLTPPRAVGLVARVRLYARLDEARDRARPVWIVAPAGSGKTSLLASYCDARGIDPVWYRLDESDADPATFVHYLGEALAKHAAASGQPVLPPPRSASADPIAQRLLLRELLAALPAGGLLVLDDHHTVPPASALHRLLAVALDEINPDLTVCVVSRNLPDGPMVRCFANGLLIDRNELLLTRDEATAVGTSLHIDDAVRVDRAFALSQGWASGLVLLLRTASMTGAETAGPLGTPRLVAQFLASELLPHLSEQEQTVLLHTAFLRVVTVEAAERLSGVRDSARVLADLHERQVFVDRLKDADGYVYHPLLRGFLAEQAAQRLEPEALRRSRIGAAEIMASTGDVAEAAALLAAAGEWQRLADCIEHDAARLIESGQLVTLERCIRLLPPRQLRQSGWSRYWLGTCLMARDPVSAHEEFAAAHALMLDRGDLSGAAETCRAAMDALFWQDGALTAQRATPWMNSLAGTLGRAQALLPNVSGLHLGGYVMLASRPGHPLTEAFVEQARQLYATTDSATLRVHCANSLVAWHNIRGEHPVASAIARDAERLTERDEIPASVRAFTLGCVAMQRWYIDCDPHDALRVAARGLGIVHEHGVRLFEHQLISQTGFAHAQAGDLDAAQRALDALRRAGSSGQRLRVSRERYLDGFIRARRGDFAGARASLEASLADSDTLAAFAAQLRVGLVRVLLAAGNIDEALEQIGRIDALAREMRSGWFRWQAQMCRAEALMTLGRLIEADAVLTRALVLGRTKGIIALPLADAGATARLLERALRRAVETEFVRRLVQQHGLKPPEGSSDRWPWPLRVYTLGRFRVVRSDVELQSELSTQQRPLQLLQALIALGGREVSAALLQEQLWPDADGDAADKAFGVTLLRLRRLLGSDAVLRLDKRKLTLDTSACWVDYQSVQVLLAQIERELARSACETATLCELMDELVRLNTGPFLNHETDEPWIIGARSRLHARLDRVGALAVARLRDSGCENKAAALHARIAEPRLSVT